MDHTSGSQTTPHASSSDMAPLDPPSSVPPQVLYMTPNHRVTKARYVTSSDPRGYVPVYEYPLNGQWIMMDTDDGYVLWTGIWKALGNSKADIVKILESQPDLATKLRRVALELARRVAWNIRYDLVPLFGPTFPDSCLSPDQPGYGKVVARPPPRTRRSKRSGQGSPPGTSAPLPFSQDSPISPITGEPNSGSTPRVTDLFESPVESNMSLVPERAFDSLATDGGLGQLAYSNQAGWSPLASIKQEPGQEQYSYSENSALGASQHTSARNLNQYGEQFVYTSPQHETSNPLHVGQGVSQMRRGSVPHISGYPAAAANSYPYQEVTIKQERNTSGDSGYGGSFIQSDPSYGRQPGIDLPTSPGEFSQYSQPGTYPPSQEVHVGSMHERSRSDSKYASYHSPQSPMGYGSPSQQSQQGYTSAPPSARGMGFPTQQPQPQTQPSTGYMPSIDQYHTQQSSTQLHNQPQFRSPQQQPMMNQLASRSQPSNPQYAATGMGAIPTYDYGYAGYQPQSTEPDLHGINDPQRQQSGTHYRSYGNQF
ncbi:unnamed protein product [Rhizoctonia solani]|uniref:Uncharacterized protein n=1 Tax=Rhizoctonia solani TaxID=456999 RepID=A0A8H3BP67_9AGAM|nr:unnamed protein product [Rhizoctonia solani]